MNQLPVFLGQGSFDPLFFGVFLSEFFTPLVQFLQKTILIYFVGFSF
jgi:hypothetical protein